jgi:hypothetical protein
VLRRFSIVFTLVTLAGLLLAACAVQPEQPEEEAAEEAGVEEAQKPQEKTSAPSPFEGEHEDLQPADAAVWREGLEITISDVHLAPNQRKVEALQRWEKDKAREAEMKARGRDPVGRDPNWQPPEVDQPDELVVYQWTVANSGQQTITSGAEGLPCEYVDENGYTLRPVTGATEKEMAESKQKGTQNPFSQPLEPGRRREGTDNLSPPTEGTTIEIICAYPPQQGGAPKIGQLPAQGKANWVIDVPSLERRE